MYLPVLLCQHPHLQQRVEDLPVQQLVPQLPVETLDVPVLPRRPGFNVQRPRSHPPKPLTYRPGRKLRPVVRADVAGHSPDHHQLGKHLYHVRRPHAAAGPDRQALPAILIHDRQQPYSPAVVGPDMHEVVRPHVVLPLRPQTQTRAVVEPQPSSLRLPGRYLQPFPSPYPLHPLVVHVPTTMPQKSCDPPVTVPAEPAGQLHDLIGQRPLVLCRYGLIALRGPGMVKRPAGPPLRDPE